MRRIVSGVCRWQVCAITEVSSQLNASTAENSQSSPPTDSHTLNPASSSSAGGITTEIEISPEAVALRNARRDAFLQGQAEYERLQEQKERERISKQSSQRVGVPSKTNVVTDVKVARKKGPWGNNQLRDAWSSDAMSRHDKDSIDKRLGSEHRYNPYERDRRILKIMLIWAIPSWLVGLGVVYYFTFGKYPWQADYQHLLNILRQMDQSPRSKLYLYRADNVMKRDASHGPTVA